MQVIPKNRMDDFVRHLGASRRVVGVRARDPRRPDRFSFVEVDRWTDPGRDYIPTLLPPKKLLLPPEETLLRFRRGEKPSFEAEVDVVPTVLLGVRPCDVKALALLDRIEAEGVPDPYYHARREALAVVAVDCSEPCDESSFCASVGAQDLSGGWDVALTELAEAYAVETATSLGKELLEGFGGLREATAGEERELARLREGKKAAFKDELSMSGEELSRLYRESYDSPVWEEEAQRCLACGTCNIVCPTCYCFDVVDRLEVSLEEGERVRRWDGCTLCGFAVVAGGHDFRKTQQERLRHRLHRKFDYLYGRFEEIFCVGCGRCVRGCLADINPLEVTKKLMERREVGV